MEGTKYFKQQSETPMVEVLSSYQIILNTKEASAFLSGDRSSQTIRGLKDQLHDQGISPGFYKDESSLENLMSKMASEYLKQL